MRNFWNDNFKISHGLPGVANWLARADVSEASARALSLSAYGSSPAPSLSKWYESSSQAQPGWRSDSKALKPGPLTDGPFVCFPMHCLPSPSLCVHRLWSAIMRCPPVLALPIFYVGCRKNGRPSSLANWWHFWWQLGLVRSRGSIDARLPAVVGQWLRECPDHEKST
jgi:hypothetical protein